MRIKKKGLGPNQRATKRPNHKEKKKVIMLLEGPTTSLCNSREGLLRRLSKRFFNESGHRVRRKKGTEKYANAYDRRLHRSKGRGGGRSLLARNLREGNVPINQSKEKKNHTECHGGGLTNQAKIFYRGGGQNQRKRGGEKKGGPTYFNEKKKKEKNRRHMRTMKRKKNYS